MEFDSQKFKDKIYKMHRVSNIIEDGNHYKIIFKDNFVLNVNVVINGYHKFYTYLDYMSIEYFYIAEMPHDSYKDLYEEIWRMSNPKTRTKLCKSNYFKAY